MRSSLRTALSLCAIVAATAVVVHAQTVDEIVAKNIQAKGGAEKLKSVRSMKLTGHLSGRGIQAPFTIWWKRPNLARQETEREGTVMVRAFDGATAWMMIGTDVQEVAGPQAQAAREQADFESPLLDYKAKGHRVELVGLETLDGAKVYHLKLTTKSGQVQDIYLDADTGFEKQTSMAIDQGGQQVLLVSEPSDYREVDGIKLPFSVKQIANGNPISQLTIDKVEFNVPVDEGIFKMPRKQPR